MTKGDPWSPTCFLNEILNLGHYSCVIDHHDDKPPLVVVNTIRFQLIILLMFLSSPQCHAFLRCETKHDLGCQFILFGGT